MTLVAGVDSSTQCCKVVIRDAATGALVRSGRAAHPDGTEVDPAAWWGALLSAFADAGGLDDVAGDLGRRPAARHGRARRRGPRHPRRPALERHPLGAGGARPDRRGRRRRVRPAHRASCRSPRSPRPSCAGCATPSRTNAARVAAVALPHDWLTWRLRGYGPAGESPLGPVLDELTTDRSDASGTAYWAPTAYDRDLLVRALGHDAILPRVLGPGEAAGTHARRHPRRARRGRQRRRRARARRGIRRRRRVDRHERHGLRRDGCPHRRRHGHGRRVRGCDRALPAAHRHAQRRPRARRDRAACSASTTPSSDASRSRPSPGHPAPCSCRTSRASARRTCPTPRRRSPG